MSLPALLFFSYLGVGIALATVAVIGKKKEDGFWSSYPWAAEPVLFIAAMIFWPVTILVVLFSSPKRKPGEPIQPSETTRGK
jgi:hypothetical protein